MSENSSINPSDWYLDEEMSITSRELNSALIYLNDSNDRDESIRNLLKELLELCIKEKNQRIVVQVKCETDYLFWEKVKRINLSHTRMKETERR